MQKLISFLLHNGKEVFDRYAQYCDNVAPPSIQVKQTVYKTTKFSTNAMGPRQHATILQNTVL